MLYNYNKRIDKNKMLLYSISAICIVLAILSVVLLIMQSSDGNRYENVLAHATRLAYNETNNAIREFDRYQRGVNTAVSLSNVGKYMHSVSIINTLIGETSGSKNAPFPSDLMAQCQQTYSELEIAARSGGSTAQQSSAMNEMLLLMSENISGASE